MGQISPVDSVGTNVKDGDSETPQRKRNWRRRIAITAGIVLIYILSSGPVIRLGYNSVDAPGMEWGNATPVIGAFYAPIGWAVEIFPPLRSAVDWWANLWEPPSSEAPD